MRLTYSNTDIPDFRDSRLLGITHAIDDGLIGEMRVLSSLFQTE